MVIWNFDPVVLDPGVVFDPGEVLDPGVAFDPTEFLDPGLPGVVPPSNILKRILKHLEFNLIVPGNPVE